MPYYVYVIRCEDGSFYTGYSEDVENRFEQHIKGKGARYTKMHMPLKVVYVEEFNSRGEAMRRELEIKSLSHDQKMQLVSETITVCIPESNQ